MPEVIETQPSISNTISLEFVYYDSYFVMMIIRDKSRLWLKKRSCLQTTIFIE